LKEIERLQTELDSKLNIKDCEGLSKYVQRGFTEFAEEFKRLESEIASLNNTVSELVAKNNNPFPVSVGPLDEIEVEVAESLMDMGVDHSQFQNNP